MESKRNAVFMTVLLGVMSATCYYLLYHFNEQILEWSKQGGWYFMVPVSIAFLFSIVHGGFTGHFWDLLGVKAKTTKKS
ncbi:hypothetical protein [Candidatus Marithrix sp. Canyon 246]|uniref:hypothetical protein n=1 Tax=Candidatus Marithrix sp. Canyon 246 TaxID=1827136 RepID=UPI00084A05D0|nr:hypothetical protein [Candidatus Marithrix sp. Canyon 246]